MKITYRTHKLFRHAGIYLQVWGKWYRVFRIGPR
jgi:hypothetical protein